MKFNLPAPGSEMRGTFRVMRSKGVMFLLVLAGLAAFLACGEEEAPVLTATPTVGVAPATGAPGPAPTVEAAAPAPTLEAPIAAVPAAPAETGVLEVRVTDAPPQGVTKVDVTVSQIEVHRAGAAAESGWMVIIDEQKTFDLVQVTGVEEVLGTDTEFPAGKYTQVRMSVVGVTVTHQGEDKVATVPSEKLRVVGSFDVEAG